MSSYVPSGILRNDSPGLWRGNLFSWFGRLLFGLVGGVWCGGDGRRIGFDGGFGDGDGRRRRGGRGALDSGFGEETGRERRRGLGCGRSGSLLAGCGGGCTRRLLGVVIRIYSLVGGLRDLGSL